MKEENDIKDRTKQFALRVIRLFRSLPKTTEAQVLGKQLLRSGTSAGANYREAHRGRSKAEHRSHGMALGSLQAFQPKGEMSGKRTRQFIAKCGDSLRELEEPSGARPTATGSTYQSAYWLELLVDGEIVAAAKLHPLRAECDELTAIFVTIIKRARQEG